MKPAKFTLSDRIAADLERLIMDGRHGPNEILPSERRLAETYGVSRTVVREALRLLAERGLVSVQHGRGNFVTGAETVNSSGLSSSAVRQGASARHLIEGRIMLEKTAAELAASRHVDTDIDEMRRLARRAATAPNMLDRVEADLGFHRAVAAAARNPVVSVMFESISSFTRELMLRSLTDPNVYAIGLPLHDEIVDAIAERDSTAAGRCMESHILVAQSRFGDDLDLPLAEIARRITAQG